MAAALPAAGAPSVISHPGVFKGRELTRKDQRLSTSLEPVNALLEGGIPRGRISEIIGRRSSGKTSLASAFISNATLHGEVAAVIDMTNAFDPATMSEAGVELSRVLWVHLGRRLEAEKIEAALKVYPHQTNLNAPLLYPLPDQGEGEGVGECRTSSKLNEEEMPFPTPRRALHGASRCFLRAAELVLEAGGFGLLVMDFGERAFTLAQSSALRLARMAERSGTAVMVLATRPVCGTFAALTLDLTPTRAIFSRSSYAESGSLKRSRTAPGQASYLKKHPPFLCPLPDQGEGKGVGQPRIFIAAGKSLFEGIEIKARIRRNKIGRCDLSAQWRSLVNPADHTMPPKTPKAVRIA
jgi:hypothetical protein